MSSESQAVGLGVGDAREMLEAHERDAAAVDHQLSRVGGSDADHQDRVRRDVHLQELHALLLHAARERDDVGAVEHRAQIRAVGVDRLADDVVKVRPLRLDHVILPVRLEQTTMSGEVAVVRGDAIGAFQNCEKIGQQVDQHLPGGGVRGRRPERRRWSAGFRGVARARVTRGSGRERWCRDGRNDSGAGIVQQGLRSAIAYVACFFLLRPSDGCSTDEETAR